ncbi:MAG: TetR/AcrR family transcriptional regulator [Actinomycetota bacterium]
MVPPHRHDSELTTAEILAAAHDLFAANGFAGTQTTEIVDRIGLTRGALYHHYGSKAGLFDAVVQGIQADLAAAVQHEAAATDGDALTRLRAGFRAYLELASRPDVRQILLVDGPSVLGLERWHEIDFEHAYAATRAAVASATHHGTARSTPVDELTHLLLGALTHAALGLGTADDVDQARTRYIEAIDRLLLGLA